VTSGPFPETNQLVAGFWVWKCASLQEAIDWAKRCPNPMPGDSEIEIRQVFEAEDFGEALTPELRAQEERLRAQVADGAGHQRRICLSHVPVYRCIASICAFVGKPRFVTSPRPAKKGLAQAQRQNLRLLAARPKLTVTQRAGTRRFCAVLC
jgi:hypothetical protein